MYIFNVVCYFSKKVVPFATPSGNAPDVIGSLKKIFTWFRRPYAIYCDRGQHFDNLIVREFLKTEGVSISYGPSGSSKSTDMVEVFNKLLEDVLRKSSENVDWDQALNRATKSVNSRVIGYLGMSPTEIVIGPIQEVTPTSSTLLALPGRNISDWVTELCQPVSHIVEVRKYIRFGSESHDCVRAMSQKRRESMAQRYDRGVRSANHQLQDLIMLYQKASGKLEVRWRGSFRIQGNGRKIRGSFHSNDLKRFIPRSGHLAEGPSDDGPDPPTQTIINWKLFDEDGDYTLDPSSIDSTFPPRYVYLLDWWVGRIIRSSIIAKHRCQHWPEDFSSKGYILSSCENKGTAYKLRNTDGVWHYAIAPGKYHLHGQEGSGLRSIREGEWTADKELLWGDEAIIQANSSARFPGVIKEDLKEIEAGLTRTRKRKVKKGWFPSRTTKGHTRIQDKVGSEL